MENADYVRQFIIGVDRERLAAEPMRRLAIIRALEVISEASRNLPDDLKVRHPEIDWRAVADAGNAYRHGYDSLDIDRVWETAVHAVQPVAMIAQDELAWLIAAEPRDEVSEAEDQ